ncbi:MAG: DUF2723 domain-containing protein [Phycisphaerales bacterium]|nr:DUF2723 domain-containing protein [Phycisphaerales bacterium]
MHAPDASQVTVQHEDARKPSTWIGPVAAALASLVVYVLTLAPSVTSEDSGELIAAANCFGIPHPPGYPLWTLLCGVFLRLCPFNSLAWRANLFSAVCSAIAVGLLCICILRMEVRAWIAVACSLVCGFGVVFWSQSVITEVYTLHATLFAALMLAMLQWRATGEDRWLRFGSVMAGLGMANHHLLGLSAAGMVAWAVVSRPALLKQWKLGASCVLLFAAGLLPYAYLPLRARANPVMNWGNPASASALWEHVTRSQYKGPDAPDDPPRIHGIGETMRQLGVMAGYAYREPTPVLFVLAMLGVVPLARTDRNLVLLLGLLTAAHTGLFICFHGIGRERDDLWASQVFFLPQYMLMAPPLAAGLNWAFGIVRSRSATAAAGWRALITGTAAAVISLVGAVPLAMHWRANDYHDYWYAYDHAVNLLNSALPNAMIIPSGDHNTFPLVYLTLVEGQRPDVLLADKYGYLDPELYPELPLIDGRKANPSQDRPLIEEWVIRHARRPVYYTVKTESPVGNARPVPVGLLYHLLPQGKTLQQDSPWAHIQYRNLGASRPCARDFGADNILADYEFFRGLYSLDHEDPTMAMDRFAKACEYGHGIKEVYNNIGCALAERGRGEEAMAYLDRAAALAPGYGVPLWNKLRVLKARKDWAAAETVLLELADATPRDFRVFGELGFIAQLRALPDETVKARFLESLRLNPAQPQVIESLAAIYARARKPGSEGSQGAAVPLSKDAEAVEPPEASPDAPLDAPRGGEEARTRFPLEFAELEWAFGRLEPGAVARHTFHFQNVGDREVKITDVLSTCSCTVPSLEQREYLPGEAGALDVVLDAADPLRAGSGQRVTVLTDAPEQSTIVLALHADIHAEFVVAPAAVQFSGARPAAPVTTAVRIRRPSAEAFELADWRSGHVSIQAQRLTEGMQVEHVLEILCDPETSPPVLHSFLEIRTAPGGERVRVPVVINFQEGEARAR